jgi:hypothetical protein
MLLKRSMLLARFLVLFIGRVYRVFLMRCVVEVGGGNGIALARDMGSDSIFGKEK